MSRKQILKQMHDVRPVREDGSLDMEKIKGRGRIVRMEHKKTALSDRRKTSFVQMNDVRSPWEAIPANRKEKEEKVPERNISTPSFVESEAIHEIPEYSTYTDPVREEPRKPNTIQLGRVVPGEFLSVSKIPAGREISVGKNKEISELFQSSPNSKSDAKDSESIFDESVGIKPQDPQKKHLREPWELPEPKKRKKYRRQKLGSGFADAFAFNFAGAANFRNAYAFVAALLIFAMIIPCFSYIQKGLDTKSLLIDSSENVLGGFAQAKDNLAAGNFEKAALNFEDSRETLEQANNEVSKIGGDLSEILRFVPGVSKVATANYILDAGENIASAGKTMAESVKSLSGFENPLSGEGNASLTEMFLNLRGGVAQAGSDLAEAETCLEKANLDDLPPEIRPKFAELKEKLPAAVSALKSFSNDSDIILDVLGYNGPRKFLFLFQNNQEMRATGGFIGSYGILDISNGKIKKLFVDDIYNPDGQLTARVIPPEPIQKMSAVWTMHDANWFPDFPTSAEKVSWFYEKTGGPTVDGVVAMTPTVIEKMLSVTGPIEMPEYDTTVDADNFIEKTQFEVEVDYDKEENRPKKFIADLTPKVLDKLLGAKDPKKMLGALNVLSSALKEKQILIYSKNYNIQKMVSAQGWSGEILATQKDFLSVVNSNINGYKTDGVIDETIRHTSEIQPDGSVIDTVSVTRRHNGGNEEFEWWNKVNGDWMRVYVPEGSKLLEADGQTREFVSSPLDYQNLGFKRDPNVQANDDSTRIDDKTGTRIYSENKKTVFANWVYVSPGEEATITYKYALPFKLSFDDLHHPADTFSVLYQKQSGSVATSLISEIKMPENIRAIWRWPEKVDQKENSFILNTSLDTDKFVGIAAEK
jgi:hypothetical protein